MWPFDRILKQEIIGLQKENLTLQTRIKDLERMLETYVSMNTVLERELEQTKQKESKYIEKLFDTVGINRMPVPTPESSLNRKIQMGRAGNWKGIQESLELHARKDYWEKKKAEEMAKD